MGNAINKLTGAKTTTPTKSAGAVKTGSAIQKLTSQVVFPPANPVAPVAPPAPLAGADHYLNPRNPQFQSQLKDQPTTSFFKNFLSSIPENLPLGVGDIIKSANNMSYEDWQNFDNAKATEWVKFTGTGLKETGQGLLSAPVRIVAEGRSVITGGEKNTITLPILGKSTSYSGQVAEDVEYNGTPLWLAIGKQIPSIIFDTIFVAAATQKAISPKESTILTSKKTAMPSNILGDEAMQAKSFRVTKPTKPTYIPVTDAIPDGAFIRDSLAKGTIGGQKGLYNPANPLFYKIEVQPGGGMVAKFVQIKPSWLAKGWNKLFDDNGRPIAPIPAEQEIVVQTNKITPAQLKQIAEAPIVKPGSLADLAAKQGGSNRPAHQVAFENAINGKDYLKAMEIVKNIPANDPYKLSMQNVLMQSLPKDSPLAANLPVTPFPPSNPLPSAITLLTEKPSTPVAPPETIIPPDTTPPDLTLEPTKATTPTEIVAEANKLDLAGSVNTRSKTTQYVRPVIGKTELVSLLANNAEFKANPVLTVNADKALEFVGAKSRFIIKPEALQIQRANLQVGEKVTVNEKLLKVPKIQQMRIMKGNETLAFNPKNLEDLAGPAAIQEVDTIVKQSEIAQRLSEKLNVPIRRGKFVQKALGIFKPGSKIVRLKGAGKASSSRGTYLPTVFHEVGHFLDSNLDFSKGISITERQALMAEYGNGRMYRNNPKKQRQEAFAEFLRFRMTGQKGKADKMAPEFSKVFDERIKNLQDIKDVLDTATADFARWKTQPAAAKILSQIAIGPAKETGSLMDRASNNLHTLYSLTLDELHPLAEFSKLAKNKKAVPAEEDPYLLARNLRGWVGKADTFLNKGTFGKKYWEMDEKTGMATPVFVGPSYTSIMKPLEQAGKLDDFRVYIVAQRAIELANRGIQTGISKADAQAALEELSKDNPTFEQIAVDRRAYKDQLLRYGAEQGLVGPVGLERIMELNKFHVPFYRVLETAKTGFMGGKKIAGNISSPIKKIKGSDRDIIDPLESDIKDTYAIINSAERNNIGVSMANLAQENFELGRLFEQVDKPMKPIKVDVAEVLGKAAPELKELIPEELAEMIVTIFRPGLDSGPNMVTVNFGDKSRLFQVEPDLFKALQGLNSEDTGMIMRILGMPARLLRAGATLTPDFSVRNPFRDQFSAFVYSKYGFVPGVDLVRGTFELFKKGDVYDLWKMGGGEHSMFVSLDREYLQKNLKGLVSSRTAKALNILQHPIDMLRVVSEIGEQATRLGEMKRALEANATPAEGAFASREVTIDFARIGAKTKALNNLIAFWNPQVQGLDRMARAFKDNPYRTLWKVFLSITLPSILLYFANRDDPRWKEIPGWQKDLFWIIMTDKHIYRIPKPFELGILFGSVPERILEFLDTHDSNLFDSIKDSVINGATPGFIPTFMLPWIENITNYSFFLDRPIVPRGKQTLPREAQSSTYTSETAKLIGETLDYSPAKIDNLIQGYTGGLGRYTTQTLDKILTGTGISSKPTPPSLGVEDFPIIKAFMIRPPVGTSSESVNRVYNEAAVISGETQYVKKLFEEGQQDKAAAYIKDHPNIVYSKLMSGVLADFTKINQARDQIRNSDSLTPDQKRDKIFQLDTLQTDIAAKIIDQIK